MIATIVKSKTKQKTFGNLLRSPSPEQPLIEENIDKEENEEEDLSSPPKKTLKKKKSVT